MYFSKLNKELENSSAPLTKRKVASIVVCEDLTTTSGHNLETDTDVVIHAEIMASRRVASGSKVTEVHLIGNGSTKHIVPCESCTLELLKIASNNCYVYLYHQDSPDKKYKIKLSDLNAVYCEREEVLDLKNELNKKLRTVTPISNEDSRFLINFINIFVSKNKLNNVKIYMSGTAAGFGPNTLYVEQRTGKKYGDIDLVIIFDKNITNDIEKFIYNSYKEAIHGSYGDTKIYIESLEPYKLDELNREGRSVTGWRKEYYTDDNNITKLDVSVGTEISDVITKQYYEKKWYIRLF